MFPFICLELPWKEVETYIHSAYTSHSWSEICDLLAEYFHVALFRHAVKSCFVYTTYFFKSYHLTKSLPIHILRNQLFAGLCFGKSVALRFADKKRLHSFFLTPLHLPAACTLNYYTTISKTHFYIYFTVFLLLLTTQHQYAPSPSHFLTPLYLSHPPHFTLFLLPRTGILSLSPCKPFHLPLSSSHLPVSLSVSHTSPLITGFDLISLPSFPQFPHPVIIPSSLIAFLASSIIGYAPVSSSRSHHLPYTIC